ncbi:MAG: sigma-54 interaction domain-containing protein [Clostridium sp.]|uniref:sigma-54 interaction domain-containing protein n=1 Tax=Clostridium sp. TaxID=1506 RepID=UPI003EE64025
MIPSIILVDNSIGLSTTNIVMRFLCVEVTHVTSNTLLNIAANEITKHDAIFIDSISENDLINVATHIAAHGKKMPIIVLEHLKNKLQGGLINVIGYYSHPLDKIQLTSALDHCLQIKHDINESNLSTIKLTGNSNEVRTLRKMVNKLSPSNANVLIRGESGTGKELIARAIHNTSNRKHKPFVPINCSAIPKELLESELFGHEKGAFTGAITSYKGRFEIADGGTLFLDEIGDMPHDMQVKLLRVLQERIYQRVGSSKNIKADVRIIAATHRDLEEMIISGDFREDLYYRLNVYPINVPSLQSRRLDIPLLIRELNQRLITKGFSAANLTPRAVLSLMQYNWPGNIRELSNLLERLAICHPEQQVNLEDLPEKFQFDITNIESKRRGAHILPPNADRSMMIQLETENSDRHFIIDSITDNHAFHLLTKEIINRKPISLPKDGLDLKELINYVETNFITTALKMHRGIVTKAAERLGIQRTTLVEKMRRLGITRKNSKGT